MTFLEMIHKTLEQAKSPLTPDEIWEMGQSLGFAQMVGSTGKTPVATVSARLYVDIRDNPNSPFTIISRRPSKFDLKKWHLDKLPLDKIEEVVIEHEPKTKIFRYKEHDLHQVLAYFAYNYLNALTKTINDKISKSGPKGKNEWLHPDMVGLDISSIKDFSKSVLRFSNQISQTPVNVYSFEIKRSIEFSNLREYYFQAVSNSRWANKGYLVCSEINLNNFELLDELRRLSAAYGIGIIKLDLNNPDESKVLYEATHNEALDWTYINILFGLNEDYKTFIEASVDVLKTESLYRERYDRIPSQSEVKEYIKLIKGSPDPQISE